MYFLKCEKFVSFFEVGYVGCALESKIFMGYIGFIWNTVL